MACFLLHPRPHRRSVIQGDMTLSRNCGPRGPVNLLIDPWPKCAPFAWLRGCPIRMCFHLSLNKTQSINSLYRGNSEIFSFECNLPPVYRSSYRTLSFFGSIEARPGHLLLVLEGNTSLKVLEARFRQIDGTVSSQSWPFLLAVGSGDCGLPVARRRVSVAPIRR